MLFLLGLALQSTPCPAGDIGCRDTRQRVEAAAVKGRFDDRTAKRTSWLHCLGIAAKNFSKQHEVANDVARAAFGLCRAELESFYFADTHVSEDFGQVIKPQQRFYKDQEAEQYDFLLGQVMAYRTESGFR
ncbi:hypothetical protein [Sphingomonas bacterium]|uniref:hypothetical protein n=1 Tax=Sphingomonas bacterium TaxID=1895847 RepID=UPI001576BFA2|nr:hypothetical protein [Sphingomonas bacterium]